MSDTSWTPILDGEVRDRALDVVRDIAEALLALDSDAGGRQDDAGVATFLTYAAQAEPALQLGDRVGEAAAAWLDRAVAGLAEGTQGPALWGGVAGVGFAIAHLAGGDEAEEALAVIDDALTQTLAVERWTGDYDLIGGLCGIGVYAIERGAPALATRVLEHLEQLAVVDPELGGLAWFTAPELLPEWQRAVCPDGYYNLGLAHGIPAVVGLMAHHVRAGIEPARARRLLDGAVAWLRAASPVPTDRAATARFTSWRGRGAGAEPGRLAWCYGDPGVALPLLLAARATDDAALEAEAIALGRMMAARSLASSGVVDMGLCHGAAGAAHLLLRFAHATHESAITMAAARWVDRTLAMRRPGEAVAGYPCRRVDDGVEAWTADPGLLTGAAGVGLALLAAATDVEPAWDRALLVDVAPLDVSPAIEPGQARALAVMVKVLVASAEAEDAAWLRRALGDAVEVVACVSIDDVLACAPRASVITLGRELLDGGAGDVLDQLEAAGIAVPCVRLGDPKRVPHDPRVAFVLKRGADPTTLAPLLISLATGHPVGGGEPPRELDADEARRRERVFAASRKLAVASDLRGAEAAAVTAVADLVGAERVHCLFIDAAAGELWSAERAAAAGDDRRADRGLVGWSARTGAPVIVARAADDPRWYQAIDDPAGRGDERLLATPVLGADREVHAVLVAVRGAGRPPFDGGDVATVQAFAVLAGPLLEQLAHHVEASAYLEEARGEELFRKEAIDAYGERRFGDVIRVAPTWIRWAYWGLVLVMIGAAVFLVTGRVHTWSRGPAIVRMQARTEVAVRTAGNVASLEVEPGARVAAGDIVARLDQNVQGGDVTRLERELEARLRERLLSPTDPASGEAVARLRLELERARAALDERLVRAPSAGVVGDVRVRPGQRVDPGDVIASVVDASSAVEIIAFLPGGDRPRLQPGQRLRLELDGYRFAYQELAVEIVAAEAMGPEEARRYLGRIGEAVQFGGPVVLVRAVLPEEFVADGIRYRYVDGMTGGVEVEVETERVIDALIPGLKRL